MPLNDKWVVITRPTHQAKNIKLKLEGAGAHPILFPLLEIIEPDNLAKTIEQLENLQDYDLLIFVSANAVEQSFKWVMPATLGKAKIATTGKKTAEILEKNGVKVDYCPKEIFNSEALLAELNFKAFCVDKKIAIIRGEGGRDYLQNQLQLSGASVDYINTYQRICPQKDLVALEQYANQGKLDAILLTSGTSVERFFYLAKGSNWINTITLVIGSPRMEKKIPECFQGKLVIVEDPSDETLYKTLTEIYI